jgi:transposase
MVDHMVHYSGLRALEVHTGGCRRRWTLEQKARIVAESFEPGAVVSGVARRHEISPQHLFAWRAAARRGELVLPADGDLEFARVVVSDPPLTATRGAGLEVRIGPALIWVGRGSDLNLLRDVVQALKAVA